MSILFDNLSLNPIIASIKDLDNLEIALDSPCLNIFLLTGNIFNLKEISQRVKEKDKGLFISVDCIDGFSKDTWGLEYIIKNIQLDGIISRKGNLIRLSKDMGVFTIEKMQINDTESLNEGLSSIKNLRPHGIDISPGIMPKIIEQIVSETRIPVIASGLISNKYDIDLALKSGAIGISSTDINTWYINY